MIKRFSVITALVVVLVIPTMAAAFGKSLCEYPFGDYGSFEVRFDQRTFDPDYLIGSWPNGGIKFELWLGFFSSEAERDKLVRSTKRVVFFNRTAGTIYNITKADKYLYVGTPSAEFSMWLGSMSGSIGDWSIFVQYNFRFFVGTFSITQQMFDQFPPFPVPHVEVLWQSPDPNDFGIDIVAPITNGDQYRLRLFDDDFNIMTNDNMVITGPPGDEVVIHSYIEENMLGRKARIETRISGTDWPRLIDDSGNCNANGMSPGATARSITWFETPPPRIPIDLP